MFRKRLIDERVLPDAQIFEIEADEENRKMQTRSFAPGSPYPDPEAAYDHTFRIPSAIATLYLELAYE